METGDTINILEKVVKLLQDNPIEVILSALVIVAIIMTFTLVYKYFNIKIENIKVTEKNVTTSDKAVDLDSLKNHAFFHNMEYMLNSKIDEINLGDKGRTLIFKDMIMQQYKVIKDKLYELCEEKIENHTELYEKNMEILDSAMKEYELEWRRMEIPSVCIDKYSEWMKNKIDGLVDSITSTTNNNVAWNVVEMQFIILDAYNWFLNGSFNDNLIVLRVLNGELSGQKYKNVVIG